MRDLFRRFWTSMELTALERDFLRAAADLARRQRELLPVVGEALGADPYHFWMVERFTPPRSWWGRLVARLRTGRPESGRSKDGQWAWYFHGFECDVAHVSDGRFVRIDFGPTSQHLTLSGWGVLQYVMCTKDPWPTFDTLARFLASEEPPWSSLSGDHAKMSRIRNRLTELKLLVAADPELCETVDRYKRVDAALGGSVIDVPSELAPPGPLDVHVCGRLVLAKSAEDLLEGAAQRNSVFAAASRSDDRR